MLAGLELECNYSVLEEELGDGRPVFHCQDGMTSLAASGFVVSVDYQVSAANEDLHDARAFDGNPFDLLTHAPTDRYPLCADDSGCPLSFSRSQPFGPVFDSIVP